MMVKDTDKRVAIRIAEELKVSGRIEHVVEGRNRRGIEEAGELVDYSGRGAKCM
jgi:hypothetical protein